MGTLVLEKTQISSLLKHLMKTFRVVSPQNKNGEVVFDDLKNQQTAVLGYKTTILPPKQYFFPTEEMTFLHSRGHVSTPKIPRQKLLIFGLSLQDLAAINYLDEIMSKPESDYFYWQRRKNSILIGFSDVSIPTTPPVGDLILEKINTAQYRVLALTPAGQKIAKLNFFKKLNAPKITKYSGKDSELKKVLLDPKLLAEAVAWSKDHKIWDELEKICLGCGICTYVCPLCYCFSIDDKKNFDNSCSRCRYWDACTLPKFAQVAGGKNFRPTLKIRYYDWFYHKFVRAYKEHGKAQCVACGRCQKYCPAGINIEKVLLQILKDYKNSSGSRL